MARTKRKAVSPVDLDAERSRLIDREWNARSRVLATVAVVASVGIPGFDLEMLRHPLEMLREAWEAYWRVTGERQDFERRVRP